MKKRNLILGIAAAVLMFSTTALAEKKAHMDWYINYGWFGGEWGRDLVTQEITKETGVDCTYVMPTGDGTEKINTMIASNTLPDLLTIDARDPIVQTLIKGKLVYSYDELANKYYPDFYKYASKQKLGWFRQADGQTYAYPNASWSVEDIKNAKSASSNYSFLVRKDIYEAIGKPDMSTPEGFIAALKKAKEKYPEIGGQTLSPIGFHEFNNNDSSLGQTLQDFINIPYEKNAKIYDRRIDAEYVKWLKTLRKANEMNLISNDVFVDRRAQIEEKIAQGRYFAVLYPWIDAMQPLTTIYDNNPERMYISVDGPKNSKKEKHKFPGPGITGWTVTLITKNCKNPDLAIKMASFMISEEGQRLTWLGKKGVTYDVVNGKEKLLPKMLELRSSNRKEYDQKYGLDYMNWMFMDNAMQDRLWSTENTGPLAQVRSYTFDKLASFVQYEMVDPNPAEKEGIILQKVNMKWFTVLPKLLTAKDDKEFDRLFKNYQNDAKKLGYDKVQAYRTNKMVENKKKLGL